MNANSKSLMIFDEQDGPYHLGSGLPAVIPAKAGTQLLPGELWVPAFAGMTVSLPVSFVKSHYVFLTGRSRLSASTNCFRTDGETKSTVALRRSPWPLMATIRPRPYFGCRTTMP